MINHLLTLLTYILIIFSVLFVILGFYYSDKFFIIIAILMGISAFLIKLEKKSSFSNPFKK